MFWIFCLCVFSRGGTTVFLVNRVFVPCQKGAVLTKTAKMTNLHSTRWKQGLRSSDPESDENDENHSGKGMV